jgi:putative peptide zinc metalloprotease protein
MGLYLLTRWEPLLLLIVVEHVEIVHQLLPIIRLDGYYIIADLTGVPDLFNRIRPIFTSLLPWQETDEKVKVLKPWVRVAVTAWVVIVIPALLLQLVIILIQLPRILGTAWDSFGRLLHQVQHAANPIAATTAAVEMVALALPILGILLMLGRLAQRSGQWVLTKTEGKPAQRMLALVLLLGAGGLLLYLWIPKGNYSPIRRNEKGTITRGVLALNPKNIVHLHSLTPPPDLSSHDTPTTVAPSPTTTVPRYSTETTSRYTTQTTSRYTTQTTSRYTTETTSGYTTQTTVG